MLCGVKLKLSEQIAPGANVNPPPRQAELELARKFASGIGLRETARVWLPMF